MAARIGKSSARGIIVSFDALRTLYRFRAPLAVQYTNVARQCGFKGDIDAGRLSDSFKRAFKHYGSRYPNYGKSELDNPEVWWTGLVDQAFGEAVDEKDLPPDLGSSLYEHFSSGAAYELYADVGPFLEDMRRLRRQYPNPDDPMIILGVITNSDPRVRQVLESLGLRIGIQTEPEKSTSMRDAWNLHNDFDFLATSYEAGYEKPNPGIFRYARKLCMWMPRSRAEQQAGDSLNAFGGTPKPADAAHGHLGDLENFTLIHVGDEYAKDYQGAESAGFEALHLVRQGEGEVMSGVKTITSLDEVAAIIIKRAEESCGATS
ncbi:hypothetical protein H2200_007713 [Cladophialophora chaetospira]|uniref:Haloacid dehalogenase-like hydrolase n=1 Tax=Cladophialophora chaetospira TaxID=386627 RepID=A0AA38X693_9EURO|nr:hypothetical protein H2200_007713 [Cladophialophora chaetospira]